MIAFAALSYLGEGGGQPSQVGAANVSACEGGGAVCVVRQLTVIGQKSDGSCCANYTVTATDKFSPALGSIAWTFAVLERASGASWRTSIVTSVAFAAAASNASDVLVFAPRAAALNGGGFNDTTRMTSPVPFNSTFSLHHRGRALRDASLAALAAQAGLGAATDVVVTGSSAGGLSALLHVDFIAAALPAASVVAMPDAGFFPLQPAADGSFQWTDNWRAGVAMWNVSSPAQVNRACFEATPAEMRWTCLVAPAFYARVAAPVYLLQSVVDWAQLASWAGLPQACLDAPLTANCTAPQLAIIRGWTAVTQGGLNVSAAMSPRAYPRPGATGSPAPRAGAGALPATNGGFFAACIQHEQGYVDRRWAGDLVGGRLMRDAFADWLFSRNASDASHWRWDVEWPGNDSCQPPGP